MRGFLESWPLVGPLTVRESVLALLVVVITLLFLVTVLFSVYALLVRYCHSRRAKRWAALTARWQRPVLLALEDPSTIPAVHKLVGERERRHFVGFTLEYTRRVRGVERAALHALVRPFLPDIAERVDHRRTEVRARAIQTLGTVGLPEYEDLVLAALDDESSLVAMVAARSLARQETPQYAEAILPRLPKFREWNRHFLSAMVASLGPTICGSLRAGLTDPELPTWVRAVYANALRELGDFQAGDAAAEVVATTSDRDLLIAALLLLGAIGRPEHVDVVRPHCRADGDVVRGFALQALGELGDRDEIALLLEAMDDPSPWSALHAARGLRDAGAEDVLEALVASGDHRAALASQVLGEVSW